jgi:hypothetical protein
MTDAVVLPGAPDQKGMKPVHTCADELRALAGNDRTAKSDDYYALSSSVMAVRQDAFRYSVALACARLSRLVYDANDNICSELEATGAQVEFFRDTNKDLFGCVAIWQEHIVVTFRGTANMRNWRLNIRIMPHILSEYSDRVSVHSGFHDAYQAVSEQVLAILDRHMKVTPRKIYLTGHSLGGAMATITWLRGHDINCINNTLHLPAPSCPQSEDSCRFLPLRKRSAPESGSSPRVTVTAGYGDAIKCPRINPSHSRGAVHTRSSAVTVCPTSEMPRSMATVPTESSRILQ